MCSNIFPIMKRQVDPLDPSTATLVFNEMSGATHESEHCRFWLVFFFAGES